MQGLHGMPITKKLKREVEPLFLPTALSVNLESIIASRISLILNLRVQAY